MSDPTIKSENLDDKLDKMENIDAIDNINKKEFSVKVLTPDELKLQEDLKNFYRDHFEMDNLWRVIKKKDFVSREFGFNLLNGGFTRNKSFDKPDHLHEYMQVFPIIGAYIGSQYQHRLKPKDRYQKAVTIHNAEWMGRELIFDLDLDDYNPVRRCKCKGKNVCEDCWQLMQEAADIMHETLMVDFGFKDLLWVYTGGRGYHCWVLDDHTFTLNQQQRTAVVDYMQLIHDPKALQKVDDIGNNSPLFKFRIYQKLARKYIMEETANFLYEHAGFTQTSLKHSRELLKTSNLLSDILDAVPSGKEEAFFKSLILYHYPRIDHKVTIDIRRLIRMPGSVHIRSKNISEFVDNPTSFNPISDATSMYDVLGS